MIRMKKYCYIVLLMIISFSDASSRDLCFCEKLFNKNGTILPDFWNKKPEIINSEKKPISFFNNRDLFRLIKEALNNNSSKKLNKLGFYGNPYGKKDAFQGSINGFKKINERFYLCNASVFSTDKNYSGPPISTVFIIDTNSVATAYPIWSSTNDSGEDLKVINVEQIDNHSFRFFITGYPGTGRFSGAPHVEAHDIDFLNKTTTWSQGLFNKDVDGDGHQELIVGCEVYYGLNWYWVSSYKNGTWRDVSNKFPNFYKTDVVKLYQSSGSCYQCDYIKKALINAAELGGPSAFIK